MSKSALSEIAAAGIQQDAQVGLKYTSQQYTRTRAMRTCTISADVACSQTAAKREAQPDASQVAYRQPGSYSPLLDDRGL